MSATGGGAAWRDLPTTLMADSALDPDLLVVALKASQTLEMSAFLELCAQGIGSLLDPESVHAYLRASGGGDLELQSSWQGRKRSGRRPPSLLDAGLIEAAGGNGHLSQAQMLRPGGTPWTMLGPEGILVLPIGEGQESVGILLLLASAEGARAFSASDVARARFFLSLVGPALRNIRTAGELRETAVRDDIVGCYNRRHFEAFLAEEVARAKRFRSRLSVLFLDMDNLKGVNTAYGHAMGSRSLQEVSGRVSAGIRKIDKLFRFGGDEFCVVLPETDTKGALEVAERIRMSISSAPLLVAEVGGAALSASLGVATFPEHGSTAEALVHAADRAMQAVKKAGKNAIGIAEPERGGTRRRPSGKTPGKAGGEEHR